MCYKQSFNGAFALTRIPVGRVRFEPANLFFYCAPPVGWAGVLQTILQRRVRRAGNEQMIHQRLDVVNCDVVTGWIRSAGLVAHPPGGILI